jgi:hypothetical protein
MVAAKDAIANVAIRRVRMCLSPSFFSAKRPARTSYRVFAQTAGWRQRKAAKASVYAKSDTLPRINEIRLSRYSFFLCRPGLGQRQTEAKNRAALAILRPDVAAVTFDDGARDGKSQTRSLRLRGDERIKDAGHIVLGNAFPRIRHSHFNGARFRILTGPDRQMVRSCLLLHGLHAIHHQIDDDLLQVDRIAPATLQMPGQFATPRPGWRPRG